MNGFPVESPESGSLAPAYGLRSTGHDLALFVAAHLAPSGRLAKAMALAMAPRRPVLPGEDEDAPPNSRLQVGLGWMLRARGDTQAVGHAGGTPGYRSFLGLRPSTGRGVVILTNSPVLVDDIGWHLLDPKIPLGLGLHTPLPTIGVQAAVLKDAEPLPPGAKLLRTWDFAGGASHWHADPARRVDPKVESRVQGGAFCTTLAEFGSAVLRWPDESAPPGEGIALATGTRYLLRFRARASAPLGVSAGVGHVTPPYKQSVDAHVPAEYLWHQFSVDFTPQRPDERAGLVFRFGAITLAKSTELCIDDVVLSTLE